MIEYIVGKITFNTDKFIILENNFKGYKIWMNRISELDLSLTHRIYVFIKTSNNAKNYAITEIYGFKTMQEKCFFEILVGANGIGPKTALLIMQNDLDLLKELISKKNIDDLQNLLNFNFKLATSVCNQLSYKIFYSKKNSDDVDEKTHINISDLVSALKSLGYKKKDIDIVVGSMNFENLKDTNTALSEAIKLIVNNKNEFNTIKA